MQITRVRVSSPTNEEIKRLAKLIKEAEAVAQQAKAEDIGTCNLDTLMIDFEGWRTSHMEFLKECLKEANIQIGDKMKRGFYLNCAKVFIRTEGQANCRTKMVEAAMDYLCQNNIPAHVWYQAD